jgi:hypothetical protein
VLDRTTKKTAVPSIVACESVATQRPSSVDFVGPQPARHTIIQRVPMYTVLVSYWLSLHMQVYHTPVLCLAILCGVKNTIVPKKLIEMGVWIFCVGYFTVLFSITNCRVKLWDGFGRKQS